MEIIFEIKIEQAKDSTESRISLGLSDKTSKEDKEAFEEVRTRFNEAYRSVLSDSTIPLREKKEAFEKIIGEQEPFYLSVVEDFFELTQWVHKFSSPPEGEATVG